MSWRKPALWTITTITVACGDVSAPGDAAPPRDVMCGAQPVEVLPNGGFDLSTPPWAQDPVTPAILCGAPRITPASAPQAACLGGVDGTTQTLTQTIPLPVGAKTLALTGQLCIDTAETATIDHDTLQFDVLNGTSVISALGKKTNQQGAKGCQFAAFQLTAPVTSDPVTATLRIRSTLDTGLPTSFYLDSLSLRVSCTP
jgi:hypothetical protein